MLAAMLVENQFKIYSRLLGVAERGKKQFWCALLNNQTAREKDRDALIKLYLIMRRGMREKEIARDNNCRRLINYSSARAQLIRRRIKENAYYKKVGRRLELITLIKAARDPYFLRLYISLTFHLTLWWQRKVAKRKLTVRQPG
jgi:hypothetical protein